MSQQVDYSPRCPAGRAAYWDYPDKLTGTQVPHHRDDKTLCLCMPKDAAKQAELRMEWLERHWPFIHFDRDVKINHRAPTLAAAIDEAKASLKDSQ